MNVDAEKLRALDAVTRAWRSRSEGGIATSDARRRSSSCSTACRFAPDGAVPIAWMGTHRPLAGEASRAAARSRCAGGKADRTVRDRRPTATAAARYASPASRRNRIDEARAAHCRCVDRPDGSLAASPRYSRLPGVVSAQCPLAATAAGRSNRRRSQGCCRRSGSTSGSTSRCRSISPSSTRPARTVKLGEYFGKRPVLLALVYYECPMLCTQVLNGVTGALKVLTFDVGQGVRRRRRQHRSRGRPGARAQKKQAYVERYGRPQTAAGWHFLTGTRSRSARSRPRSASATPTTRRSSSTRTAPGSSC